MRWNAYETAETPKNAYQKTLRRSYQAIAKIRQQRIPSLITLVERNF